MFHELKNPYKEYSSSGEASCCSAPQGNTCLTESKRPLESKT